MKVVAQRGRGVFIIEERNEEGFIYNQETRTISRRGPIQAFLKFGYWERPGEDANKILDEVAKLVD